MMDPIGMYCLVPRGFGNMLDEEPSTTLVIGFDAFDFSDLTDYTMSEPASPVCSAARAATPSTAETHGAGPSTPTGEHAESSFAPAAPPSTSTSTSTATAETTGMAAAPRHDDSSNGGTATSPAYATMTPIEKQAYADPRTALARSFLAAGNPVPRKETGGGTAGRMAGFKFAFNKDVMYACAHYPEVFRSWTMKAAFLAEHPDKRCPSDGTVTRHLTDYCREHNLPTPKERQQAAARAAGADPRADVRARPAQGTSRSRTQAVRRSVGVSERAAAGRAGSRSAVGGTRVTRATISRRRR